jgi:signal transduction histidine kinase
MEFTYQTKLYILITLLSVLLTAVSMTVIYRFSYGMMFDRITKNLVDVGRLGRMMLDDESIAAIKRLKSAVESERTLTDTEVLQLPYGEAVASVSPAVRERLHASADFQLLVKKLRQISVASLHFLKPHADSFEPEDLFDYFSRGMIDPYLMVTVDGFPPDQYFQYLVSSTYEPLDNGWPGSPIGTISHAEIPIDALLEETFYVAPELITDVFYTSASAMVILKDPDGSPVAALGVDYPVGSELNKLAHLRYLSYLIVLVSGLFGYALSRLISKRMSRSLHQLRDAAQLIEQGHYDEYVAVDSNDEFSRVATAFNRMVSVVGKTLSKLESSNERLRSVTADMHDGVGSVLTNIRIGSSPPGNMKIQQIHRLAGHGLEEIRFLMDALEYERIDLTLLEEGLCILCADILDSHEIDWSVEVNGLETQQISFQLCLDIQRVAREALTNIIKHSSSQKCFIAISHGTKNLEVTIANEGTALPRSLVASTGRGLDNMRYRVERHGGGFSVLSLAGGYRVEMSFVLS